MTIEISKKMIAEEICHHLCSMAESAQDQSFQLTDSFVLLKNWNGSGSLTITWEQILQGYHCYGTDRIPSFISRDWDMSLKIYKILKGL